MKYFIILKNGQPEKVLDDPYLRAELEQEFKVSGNHALMMVSSQLSNVFEDESVAKICCQGLQEENPVDRYSVAELHLIMSTIEWS